MLPIKLVAIMLFSFARVSAVIGMNVGDYFQKGKRHRFRLHEKGGKCHEVPAHHNAKAYVDTYVDAAGIAADRKSPLFRSFNRRLQLTGRRMHRTEALLMISAGPARPACPRTSAATRSEPPASPISFGSSVFRCKAEVGL